MDNSYVPWSGVRKAHASRMRYFIVDGTRRSLRSRWTLVVLLIPYMLVVIPSLFSAFFQSSYPGPLDYYSLYDGIWLFAILLAALVGSGIFASDISHMSHILLYVHGLKKGEYVVGRITSFFISLLSLTLLPLMAVFIVSLASGSGTHGLADGTIDFLSAGGAMLFMTLYFCLLTSALSCMSGDKKYAGAGLVALFFISSLLSEVLFEISSSDLTKLISIQGNMDAVVSWGIGTSVSFPERNLLALIVIMALCAVTIYYRLMGKEVAR